MSRTPHLHVFSYHIPRQIHSDYLSASQVPCLTTGLTYLDGLGLSM